MSALRLVRDGAEEDPMAEFERKIEETPTAEPLSEADEIIALKKRVAVTEQKCNDMMRAFIQEQKLRKNQEAMLLAISRSLRLAGSSFSEVPLSSADDAKHI